MILKNPGKVYHMNYSLFLLADILIYIIVSKAFEFIVQDKVHLYFLSTTLLYYGCSALSSYLGQRFLKQFDHLALVIWLHVILIGCSIALLCSPWNIIEAWMVLTFITVMGSISGILYISFDSTMDKRMENIHKFKSLNDLYYWKGVVGFSSFLLGYKYLVSMTSIKIFLAVAVLSLAASLFFYAKLHMMPILREELLNPSVETSRESTFLPKGFLYLIVIYFFFCFLVHSTDPLQTLYVELRLQLTHENQFIFAALYYVGVVGAAIVSKKILDHISIKIWLPVIFLTILVFFISLWTFDMVSALAIFTVLILLSSLFKIYIRYYLHLNFSASKLEYWLSRLDVIYNGTVLITTLILMWLSKDHDFSKTIVTYIVLASILGLASSLLIPKFHSKKSAQ